MHGPSRKCKPDQGQGEWDGEQVRVLESSYDGTARPESRIILHPCLHFLLHRMCLKFIQSIKFECWRHSLRMSTREVKGLYFSFFLMD